MRAARLREGFYKLAASRRIADVAPLMGTSQSYAWRLLTGENRLTDALLRRWRTQHPELRALCDALLLEGGDRRMSDASRTRETQKPPASSN